MMKRFIFPVLTILGFGISAVLVILFTKGYHYFPKTGTIEKIGLLIVTSTPPSASIYINDHLTEVTNATIKLVPDTYKVGVARDGYTTWEKEVKVEAELVTTTNIVLFPDIPELRPLTATSAKNPVLSPDGQKIAFTVPQNDLTKKAGIWVLNMVSSRPFGFGRIAPRQIVTDTPWQKFSEAKITWSPDSKSLLASFNEEETVYLLDPEASVGTQNPKNITPRLPLLKKEWGEEEESHNQQRLTLLPPDLQKIATTAALAHWSPDEQKLLYQTEGKGAMVYDPKWEEFPPKPEKAGLSAEEKGKIFELPEALDYLWLPEAESKHIILVEEGQISVVESEGTNKMIVFGGEFEEDFVVPWPDGSKLVISTSLNKPAGVPPNLYTINLK